MDHQLRRAIEFLEHDPLRNIVLLKTLFYYPHAIRCHFNEGPKAAGVLLLLSGDASPFDRRNYPGTDHVVFIAATEPAFLPELMAHVPRGERLLFKLRGPHHYALVRRFFSLERVNAFVSYTAPPDKLYASAEGVTVSGMPGERLPGSLRRHGPFARGTQHSLREWSSALLHGVWKRQAAGLVLHIPELREDIRNRRRLPPIPASVAVVWRARSWKRHCIIWGMPVFGRAIRCTRTTGLQSAGRIDRLELCCDL